MTITAMPAAPVALVVEDDPASAEVVRAALRHNG
jgi:hypothetical protein